MTSEHPYDPRSDALLAAPPPILLGTLVPLLLAGLQWLDRTMGATGDAVLRLGPWQAYSSVTALLGLLIVSGVIVGLATVVAAAIVLRFPLWHHAWIATAFVLALAFVALLSQGNLSPLLLALATPLLLLSATTWLWAWHRDPTQAGIFGLSAAQALTLVLLMGASRPPLQRPELIAWAVPLGLLDAVILYLVVSQPPARRWWVLVLGVGVNLLPLPWLDGTHIGTLWVGLRGLFLLGSASVVATLLGPLWLALTPQPQHPPT